MWIPPACTARTAETFDPSTLAWSHAGTTPAPLVNCGDLSEIGPQVLMHNGQGLCRRRHQRDRSLQRDERRLVVGTEFSRSSPGCSTTGRTLGRRPAARWEGARGSQLGSVPAADALLPLRRLELRRRFPTTARRRSGTTATPTCWTCRPGRSSLRHGTGLREHRDLHRPGLAESGMGAGDHLIPGQARRRRFVLARRAPAERALRRRRLRRRLSVQHRLSAGADHQRRQRRLSPTPVPRA